MSRLLLLRCANKQQATRERKKEKTKTERQNPIFKRVRFYSVGRSGAKSNEWGTRLNRTTVNVWMFCPPVYYQRNTFILPNERQTLTLRSLRVANRLLWFVVAFLHGVRLFAVMCANERVCVCVCATREKRNDHNRKTCTYAFVVCCCFTLSSARQPKPVKATFGGWVCILQAPNNAHAFRKMYDERASD